jgi:hypothetical protein
MAATFVGEELRFQLQVHDPDGDEFHAVLLNPPPGLVFAPIARATAPVEAQVRWVVPSGMAGTTKLVFLARDRFEHSRFEVRIRVAGDSRPTGLVLGDVTGDGLDEIIGNASSADLQAGEDAGMLCVWNGRELGNGAPAARLLVPWGQGDDRLGLASGQGVQIEDVTGDGVNDVVVAAALANLGGGKQGAIYVFAGSGTLEGDVAPHAMLQASTTSAFLGSFHASAAQGVLIEDLNGDGHRDVLAACSRATIGAVSECGAIYLWAGGPGMVGSRAPSATLRVSGARPQDRLGEVGGGGARIQGVHLVDVTGDGKLDVVSGTALADHSGRTDAGALYVWAGGPGLSGNALPRATLTALISANGDRLGDDGSKSGPGLVFGDVTGDGVLDIVAGARHVDFAGTTDAGALYAWAGGEALLGTITAHATLTVPGIRSLELFAGQGAQLADLTGDAILDVCVGSPLYDAVGATDAGAVFLWAGGQSLAGFRSPSKIATVPGGLAYDRLGQAGGRTRLLVEDFDGDGVSDLIVPCPFADVEGVADRGGIYVWRGGPSLIGASGPSAVLQVASASAHDRLGDVGPLARGLFAVDVTGDGLLDLVSGSAFADLPGAPDAGALYVWAGGSDSLGLAEPLATLTAAAPETGDRLAFGGGLHFGDVGGDGIADVLATGSRMDVGGVEDAGAILLWNGGNELAGARPPAAKLLVDADPLDVGCGSFLVQASRGEVLQLVDANGDFVLDVVVLDSNRMVGGLPRVGAVFAWYGGGFSRSDEGREPSLTLSVAGSAYDGLGALGLGAQGLRFADVTGDLRLDAIAGASRADAQGVEDAGAFRVWKGPLSHNSTQLSPLAPMPRDRLGE